MYSKIAEEEDDRMVERWQKDAEGIIIFVCSGLFIQIVVHINCDPDIDRPILCCRCRTGRCVDSGHQA